MCNLHELLGDIVYIILGGFVAEGMGVRRWLVVVVGSGDGGGGGSSGGSGGGV